MRPRDPDVPSRDSECGEWEALRVPVLGARWWRLPRRREASVTECAWCVPGDWAALTGLRVARPVDPQIGIDLRMQRVRGRWGSEPPEARIAPHRYPPAASPVMDGAAAVLGGVDDEVLAAGEPRDLEAVPDVGSSPVVVSGVEHKAAHLGDPDLAQLAGGTCGGLPIGGSALQVHGRIREPGERGDAIGEQPDAIVAPPCRETVDRPQRVGLERDDHPGVPENPCQRVVPGPRGRVLPRGPSEIVWPTRGGLGAQHGEKRNRTIRLRGVEDAANLDREVRSCEAPDPEALRLAGDLPDQVGLVAPPGPPVGEPLPPRRRLPVDEEPDALERIRAGRVDTARVYLGGGGGRRSESRREQTCAYEETREGFPSRPAVPIPGHERMGLRSQRARAAPVATN